MQVSVRILLARQPGTGESGQTLLDNPVVSHSSSCGHRNARKGVGQRPERVFGLRDVLDLWVTGLASGVLTPQKMLGP